MMKLYVSSSSSVKMATTGAGGLITLPNLIFPSSPYCSRHPKSNSSSISLVAAKLLSSHRNAVCCAVQESSAASTVAAETKKEKEEEPPAAAAAPAKPKAPAKAPVKALPEMMEEDVIPSLRSILGAQEDISELDLFYEDNKNKVPLLSLEALHHHIFIFVLAVVHVTFSVLTVVFGGAKIRQWKHWEASIEKENFDTSKALEPTIVTHVRDHDFIRSRFVGLGKRSAVLGWLLSFFKQFYGSVTKSDYLALRLGFIATHCRGNPKFNFHKYMIRALEDDFRKVVGISWYLWVFVVVFLLLNINGWHTYFWIAFVPFILLLAVGTKLEHIITQLAHEVAEKHVAIEGELVVKPSDDHFWFHRPRIILLLIHFILFQNAFEIAFFFWILVQFGFDSCIMGKIRYIIPRLVIGVFIEVMCSYSTLPLYAIVTQMGSHFKKSIFDEHIQVGLMSWAQKAKKKKALNVTTDNSGGDGGGSSRGGVELQGIQIARDTD